MSKAVYFRRGDTYSVADDSQIDMLDELPPGNYSISQDPFGNFHFEVVEEFTLPEKLYGDVSRKAARILTTFEDRPGSTGVLLGGEKGSGKTMLAKKLSIDGKTLGLPTLIINQAWCGEAFNNLIQSMKQPAILLFDEYEKVYADMAKQEQLLTLMDGTFSSKKLFILTCNNKYKVAEHMRNRPGRLYYVIDYIGLDAEFIREYCLDNLKNKALTEQIVNAASVFSAFNFDMLKALVEEVNRYGESPAEALGMLNIQPQYESDGEFTIKVALKDANKVVTSFWPNSFTGNPLTKPRINLNVDFKVSKVAATGVRAPVECDGDGDLLDTLEMNDEDDDEKSGRIAFVLTQENLTKMNSETGAFLYETPEAQVFIERRKPESFSWGRSLDMAGKFSSPL